MLIAVIGLVGCGAPAEKEVAAEAKAEKEVAADEPVTEEVVEDVLTEEDESEEEVATDEPVTEEAPEVPAPESVEDPAQEIVEDPAPVKHHVIDFMAISAEFSGSESGKEAAGEATPFEMTVASEKANNVSEIPDWLNANELSLPLLGGAGDYDISAEENAPTVSADMMLFGSAFYDENYIYDWTDTCLSIYDRNSCRLLHTVSYQMDRWYFMGNCASLQDGILYMGYLYNGYAMPGTCYLLAYDLENDAVLWRSADQTYNTMNFIIKEDVIICGYGFTDEQDFIYQIDKNTGSVVAQLELKKMPELLVEKDGQLYVHSYSYDYVLDVVK